MPRTEIPQRSRVGVLNAPPPAGGRRGGGPRRRRPATRSCLAPHEPYIALIFMYLCISGHCTATAAAPAIRPKSNSFLTPISPPSRRSVRSAAGLDLPAFLYQELHQLHGLVHSRAPGLAQLHPPLAAV